jgi:hypothetical protein
VFAQLMKLEAPCLRRPDGSNEASGIAACRVGRWSSSNAIRCNHPGARACEAHGEHADAPLCGFERHLAFEVSCRVRKNHCTGRPEDCAERADARNETAYSGAGMPYPTDGKPGDLARRRCITTGGVR